MIRDRIQNTREEDSRRNRERQTVLARGRGVDWWQSNTDPLPPFVKVVINFKFVNE